MGLREPTLTVRAGQAQLFDRYSPQFIRQIMAGRRHPLCDEEDMVGPSLSPPRQANVVRRAPQALKHGHCVMI